MHDRSRWIALVVLCTGMLMIVLDITILNVALPSIRADLGFSQSSLAWVVNAYLIAFAGLLLLAGRLGDLAGRGNVFIAGLGVFTVASLLCGLAANQEMLVAARLLQGIGGALTSAVILGTIVTMFSDPREQATAIGIFAFVASVGAAVGLLAGGILTQLRPSTPVRPRVRRAVLRRRPSPAKQPRPRPKMVPVSAPSSTMNEHHTRAGEAEAAWR